MALDRQMIPINPNELYTNLGVRSFGKGVFHYDPVPGAKLSRLRFFRVKKDRLLLSNIKAWEGAIAVTSGRDEHCVASNRFLPYMPIENAVDVNYLRFFFLSGLGLPLIQRASPGSADRNRTLAMSRFEAIEIPLPSLDEQRWIAETTQLTATAAEEVARRREEQERRLAALPFATFRSMFEALS